MRFTVSVFSPAFLYVVFVVSALLGGFFTPLAVSASTEAPSYIYQDTIWAVENSPYIVMSRTKITSGATLTIQEGVIVKFFSGASLEVYGNLVTEGTDQHPVYFTSYRDDTVGGDTNGDGAMTVPAPLDWSQVEVWGVADIKHAVFRYGGYSVISGRCGYYWYNCYGALFLNTPHTVRVVGTRFHDNGSYAIHQKAGTLLVSDSIIENNSTGLLLHGGFATIQNSTLRNNGTGAVAHPYNFHAVVQEGVALSVRDSTLENNDTDIAIRADTPFMHSGNRFFGARGHHIMVSNGMGMPTASWTHEDGLPYLIQDSMSVPAGSSLVLQEGVIVKFLKARSTLTVNGTLTVQGTEGNPVYFTSYRDDSVGGDTNGDGATTAPAPGDWSRVRVWGGVMNAQHMVVRYGGFSVFNFDCGGFTRCVGGFFARDGAVNISNSQFAYNNDYGIYQHSGSITASSSDFTAQGTGVFVNGGTAVVSGSAFHSNGTGVEARVYTDARNNWWGDASGPRHAGNPAGRGDSVSNNVAFTPWLGDNPLAPSGCTENCFSNVLFLPGLEASRLYAPGIFFENQLWEPNRNADAEELFLNIDGTSVRDDIYTRDVIDNAYVITKGNIYKSFLAEMKTWESDYGITAMTIPYDWRLPLDTILSGGLKTGEDISYLKATSSPYIIQELRRLAETSKTGKVTIVAHSNGGLLTKALTQKLGVEESAKLIDKIVLVAVPQTGTPKAIGAILHGYEQGLPMDSLSLALSPEVARIFAKNMPAAYNLLPSAQYFASVTTPVATFDDSNFLADLRARYGAEINSVESLRIFMNDTRRNASSTPNDLEYPSVGNAGLLSSAETVHATLDAWVPPAGVSLYEIAGWGEDTLATVEYYEGKKTICAAIGATSSPRSCFTYPVLSWNPKEVVDGDGTVVTPSALWTSTASTTKYWIDLLSYGSGLTIKRKHADILEVLSLRVLIKDIITKSAISSLPDFISTTTPTTNIPNQLRFVLHSPLRLSAVDNLGNITDFATTTIPGSSFTRYSEVQVLKVPKGTPVTLNLAGYATGSFTLDMQEIDGANAVIASSTLSAIPSATSTLATISLPDGVLETATPLAVDYDGEGTADFTVAPKEGETVVFDTTPPEARISFSVATQSLLVTGIDQSPTTIRTTATSTLITDSIGNTLEIMFSKFKQEGKQVKLELSEIRRNGVSTPLAEKTALQYEWSTGKAGNLKELQEKSTVSAVSVDGHYDAEKNITKIHKKMKRDGDKEEKEMLSGVVIVSLVIREDGVEIGY